MNMASKLNAIILDIEGTTTSISFVKDILFPYAREHLDSFLTEHWGSEDCSTIVNLLRDQASADGVTLPAAESDPALLREGIRRYVLSLMDADRKVTALKHLQGLIWTRGYLDGHIIGHVYGDVPAALEQWNRQDISVWIYSSGSIAAQKLLFGHTEHGSLLKHFSGHFDTTTGPKTEVESYRKIAAAIGSSPEQILFVTDILKKLWRRGRPA
ncbi:enolase-phosphatase E1-like isoform X2 [Amphibalanus amphitrite]|uniref:enolase-phosphatase E1-like isoform X2 n=1 Tax=Amphibalanus amphitrite TaxID=1232801 RepID=UPI001C904ADE|nr:enolase-phosphatase E1-like isoform X2 [Amphibalanus amphitrite]